MNRIFKYMLYVCLCYALPLAGQSLSPVRVADMGYDSKTNNFYIVLENHTPYLLRLYNGDVHIVESMMSNPDNFNKTYVTFLMRDKHGKALNKVDPTKAIGGPLTNILHHWWGVPPEALDPTQELKTFVCYMGIIPNEACTLECTAYLKFYPSHAQAEKEWLDLRKPLYLLTAKETIVLTEEDRENIRKDNEYRTRHDSHH